MFIIYLYFQLDFFYKKVYILLHEEFFYKFVSTLIYKENLLKSIYQPNIHPNQIKVHFAYMYQRI